MRGNTTESSSDLSLQAEGKTRSVPPVTQSGGFSNNIAIISPIVPSEKTANDSGAGRRGYKHNTGMSAQHTHTHRVVSCPPAQAISCS